MVPVHQWPAILFGFAAVIAVWSLLAYFSTGSATAYACGLA